MVRFNRREKEMNSRADELRKMADALNAQAMGSAWQRKHAKELTAIEKQAAAA